MKHIPAMSKQRARMGMRHPFWGSLCMSFEVQENVNIPTADIDGKVMRFNKDWFEALSPNEQLFLLVHETLHVLLKHHIRRGDRRPRYWNAACDYAINNFLSALDDPDLEMPKGGLYRDDWLKLSAEEIYEQLIEEYPPQERGSGSDVSNPTDSNPDGTAGEGGEGEDHPDLPQDPCGGEVRDLKNPNGGTLSEAELSEEETFVNIEISKAAAIAKSIGKLGGKLKSLIDKIIEPKVDWRTYVRKTIMGDQPSDYSYRRMNRKYLFGYNTYLPGIINESLGKLVAGVDCSASVFMDEYHAFLAELNALSTEFSPKEIHMVYCDTQVNHKKVYEQGEEITALEMHGGGGTCVTPIFDYIEQNDLVPDTLIYFTDGAVNDYPVESPGYQVIVATTDCRGNAPEYATEIYIKE